MGVGRHWRGRWPRLRRRMRAESVVVCGIGKSDVRGVWRSNSSLDARWLNLDAKTAVRTVPAGSSVILLIPKSQYLTRVMDLPIDSPGELQAMIHLEAEAHLPAGYGEIEVSFRRLGEGDRGFRYEVYIVRRAVVEDAMARLEALQLQLRYMLPSAVLWLAALKRVNMRARTFAVASVGPQQFESAHRLADGSIAVRAIVARDDDELRRGLVNSARAISAEAAGGSSVVELATCGISRPRLGMNGQVSYVDLTESLCGAAYDPAADPDNGSLLQMAAHVFVSEPDDAVWTTANLMPRSLGEASVRRLIQRQLLVGAAGFLAALLLVWVALAVSTWRYERQISALDAAIAHIQHEGQRVGRQLGQLEAVTQARATRADFATIIAGLHVASAGGGGLSYNQVDLREDGTLLLRGQADSLALPFELPQKLEALPAFSGVMLRDAGQAKKGAGSVTEFRMDAQYKREGRR